MFKSVVVPLDGSAFGERALPIAVAITEKCGAALHLVHVHSVTPPDAYLDALTPYIFQNAVDSTVLHDEDVKQDEMVYLDRLARRARSRVPVTTSELRLGVGVESEVEAAVLGWQADLVVMATHAREGFDGFMHGSIAEAVMRRLGRPTILVPAAAAEVSVRYPPTPRHIVITLDGSAWAEAVIAPAAELAKRVGARVTLLAVQDAPSELPEYLQQIARTTLADLPVTTYVIDGLNPADAIIDYLRDHPCDVIAMATHGRTGVSRLMYGSVAGQVLHASHKPVLLLRPNFSAARATFAFSTEAAPIA
jgi:nucleotide-binding universal stress UspA family protein